MDKRVREAEPEWRLEPAIQKRKKQKQLKET